jgi:guanylate kinase
MDKRKGILCVVSGPSGSGKTTLCRNVSEAEDLYYTVSCTTRKMRDGEEHGRDYFFLSESEFAERVTNGEFLEHATVHGRHYGTLKSQVLPHLALGRDVIMDLDTQGAEQLRHCQDPDIQISRIDVFILPRNREEFRLRLAARHTETAEQIAVRLCNAEEEITHWREYVYAIISGTREEDLSALRSILAAERQKTSRMTGRYE